MFHSVLVMAWAHIPLCPGVVALYSVSARLSLQVASNGKQEPLKDCHAYPTPPVPHLRNDIHHPAICLRVIALHIAKGLMLRDTSWEGGGKLSHKYTYMCPCRACTQ